MTEITLHEDAYQTLMNKLGEGGPILGERTLNVADGFLIRDSAGKEASYQYLDIILRADDTYWSPLGAEDRLTLYNISDYTIQAQDDQQWLGIAEWFSRTGK